MAVNRILSQVSSTEAWSSASARGQWAESPASGVWVGVVMGASPDVAAQQYLYRVAQEQARQALSPPLHYRRLFSNWN